MKIKNGRGLCWLEFELLQGYPVIHACLTRHGGCSLGLLESLNLGGHVGDRFENVAHNVQLVKEVFAINHIVKGRVCHGMEVTSISSSELEVGVSDGLSTNQCQLGIMMTQADCQVAIFYDPAHHAIANVHCGWRGNVLNIYQAAVAHMQRIYHSDPKKLLVCISPSLGPDSSQFVHYKKELPEPFWQFQIKPTYFDLWALSEWQLKNAGVLAENIEIAGIDTYACEKDYFSYRRNRLTGRQATICALL